MLKFVDPSVELVLWKLEGRQEAEYFFLLNMHIHYETEKKSCHSGARVFPMEPSKERVK